MIERHFPQSFENDWPAAITQVDIDQTEVSDLWHFSENFDKLGSADFDLFDREFGQVGSD